MNDNFGRIINYLRLSVTDRCNLDCSYCKRAASKTQNLMTLDEIQKITRLFAEIGIRKIRLTGGEPLTRTDICEIIYICKNTEGIREVAMTTNGILLSPEKAKELRNAGLDRVNISIDGLDPGKYKQIARAGSLTAALSGINASLAAGLAPIKINTVLMRGVNDGDIERFIALTDDRDVRVRFIEYMPMGGKAEESYISAEEVINARPWLKNHDKVEFICSVSQPFCNQCNRVRVTADCKLRLCLGNNLEFDLREMLLRDNAAELLRNAIAQKPQRGFCDGFVTNRGMGNIGG